MTTKESLKVTYIFDAYCGWCWGLSGALGQYAQEEGDNVQIEVLSGGLFSGDRAAALGDFSHIPEANQRISQLTGAEFGEPYQAELEKGTLFIDSDDASRGLVALKRVAPGRDVELAHALQSAFYLEGLSLSEDATYSYIAQELGLNSEEVLQALKDPETAELAAKERAYTKELGVNSYPTLLVHTQQGLVKVGSPVRTSEQLKEDIAQAVEKYNN